MTNNKFLKYLCNPKKIPGKLQDILIYHFPNITSNDKLYLEIYYRLRTGKKLDLKNPKTFNEKTQWLKLFDRKPEYTQMADKYSSSDFVSERIGNEYTIPLLGVWDHFSEIDFSSLPNRFALKCTHDSGGVAICTDKKSFRFLDKKGVQLDMATVKEKMNSSLRKNYFYKGREWAYKDILPRIIAQEFIENNENKPLMDYKIFTFNGKPKFIQVHLEKSADQLKANFYSTDWCYQEFCIEEQNDKDIQVQKPLHLAKMLELAEKLSQGTLFLRVDFFYINDKIYFGEFGFYNWGGFGKFTPECYDELLGSYITLPG